MEIPELIEIEPSNICNLRCEICPRGNGDYIQKNPRIMTFGEFTQFVNAYDYPMTRIQFCGTGEPLYNPHLAEMIKYVKSTKNPDVIELISNGIFMTHGVARDLVRAGLTKARLSIDGCDKPSYESARHYDFDIVARNAAALGEAVKGTKTLFGINCVINQLNKDALTGMPAFAQLVGADELEFRIYETNGQKKKELAVHDRDYLEKLKTQVMTDCEQRGIKCDFWDIDSVKEEGCNLGTEVNVNAHSFITPCYHLPEMNWIKVSEEKFSSIWESERIREFFQRMKEGKFLEECCCLEAMVKK